jgi:hypothetical protein
MFKNKILIKLRRDENKKIDEFVCYSPKQAKDVTERYRF